MKSIDLNCDVAEGMNNEAELMPFISSCNIACGLHAGDDKTIDQVVRLAIDHKVIIGAHPSFDDRANFGRLEMQLSNEELTNLIQSQVWTMKKRTEVLGGKLSYVKPHGALYNMAALSTEMSEVIISSIKEVDGTLRLMGLADSAMEQASSGRIGFISEGFADRRYASQNSLRSRAEGGLITDFEEISKQLRSLLESGKISTVEGMKPLVVQSICLHGDTPGAGALIARIRDFIYSLGFEIKAS